MPQSSETIEIAELGEAHERVEFPFGNVMLWHDAFLNRISNQNPTYVKLVRAGRDLNLKTRTARLKLSLYGDEAWLQNEMLRPIAVPAETEGEEETLRLPNSVEMAAREKEVESAIDTITKELDKLAAAEQKNKAERVVYLTKAWPLTDKGQPVKCTAGNVLKHYSDTLLDLALSSIEGRVFGPLVTQPDYIV
ncbi:MAG: hypothetical protein KY445_02705 [Armatimonadetes bacterium]|nr:hypothetical protein [Armatimonadota bacterium]